MCCLRVLPNDLDFETNYLTNGKNKRRVFKAMKTSGQSYSNKSCGVIGLSKCKRGFLWLKMAILTNALTLCSRHDERG